MKNFWIEASEDQLTGEGLAEATYVATPGSTLILVRGMTLHNDLPIVRNRKPSTFNQDVKAALPLGDISADYIPYLLLGHKSDLMLRVDSAGHGTGRLPLEVLQSLKVRLPRQPLQKTITQLLGSLDDKIELNRRMAETLEAMARALFRSWFVDFDPVHARAEGRPSGLPGELAALFPDSFGDDGLPHGWCRGSLADIAVLNPENWTNASIPATLNYVDLASVKWGRIDPPQVLAREDAPSRAQRVLVPGDTIVGTVRPGNGSYAFISRPGLTGSTGFAVLRPSRATTQAVVYLTATRRENIEALAHLADGAAYPAVHPEVVADTPLALPGNAVFDAFNHATAPLLNAMSQRQRQSETLADLRGALLPKLISGELRIADAEQRVAAA